MNIETAKKIMNAADDMGLDLELREDYSGRGMYGKTTAGIVGSPSSILSAVCQASYDIGLNSEDGVDCFDDFFHEIQSLRWDSMAMRSIVY